MLFVGIKGLLWHILNYPISNNNNSVPSFYEYSFRNPYQMNKINIICIIKIIMYVKRNITLQGHNIPNPSSRKETRNVLVLRPSELSCVKVCRVSITSP